MARTIVLCYDGHIFSVMRFIERSPAGFPEAVLSMAATDGAEAIGRGGRKQAGVTENRRRQPAQALPQEASGCGSGSRCGGEPPGRPRLHGRARERLAPGPRASPEGVPPATEQRRARCGSVAGSSCVWSSWRHESAHGWLEIRERGVPMRLVPSSAATAIPRPLAADVGRSRPLASATWTRRTSSLSGETSLVPCLGRAGGDVRVRPRAR